MALVDWFTQDQSFDHTLEGTVLSVLVLALIGAWFGLLAGIPFGMLLAVEYLVLIRRFSPDATARVMRWATVAIVIGVNLFIVVQYLSSGEKPDDVVLNEAVIPSVLAVAFSIPGVNAITRTVVTPRLVH